MLLIRRGGVTNLSKPFHRSFFNFPSSLLPTDKPQEYIVKKRLNFTPELLFDVVSDVSQYHEFVPFVEESFVSATDSHNLPAEAGLRVGWKQFDEKFTCKLTCEKNKSVKAESLTVSLFESLNTQWKFREVKNPHIRTSSCEVELSLSYAFKNPVYNAVSSLFSEQVTQLMIKAFEQRARDEKLKMSIKDRPRLL
ncbi:coenzyme Q-binding protein Coq10p, mitochondrial [[Candida] anglica]|uniref:Coenzyme Q-binding protein Coq10p, mitochondrial n=1 Tax=[Candida] anglica TaxID=148631 RepID=A0ABP0EER3_9ASCO